MLYTRRILVAGDEASLAPTRVEMPPPFGSWLRQQRERSGLSQAEIAALLDASVQSVIGWEKGRRYPRRDVEEWYRRRIAAAADEAVRVKMALTLALSTIADDDIRVAVARRFGVDPPQARQPWDEERAEAEAIAQAERF
jgi:transcriptional regulator with XRE-family HTH domain